MHRKESAMPFISERRRHERFKLVPMYCPVVAKIEDHGNVRLQFGHAYDISEAGVRIELDEALQPGTIINLDLQLDGGSFCFSVTGAVVWVNDEADDPGPRRMAVEFVSFSNDLDRLRFIGYLGNTLGVRCAA